MNAAIERASRDEIEALQRERLAQTVERVRRTPLGEREFTTKDDLREHYPLGLLAVAASELRRIHASSGSRGRPTVVAYTQHDLDVWSEVMARCMAMAGVKPGMVVHNAYGYGLFTGGLGFHQGAERLGALTIPVSRRRDGAPGAAAARPAGPGAVLHAVLRAPHRAGAARGGDRHVRARVARSACSAPSRGPTRCATSSSPSSA